jgi:N,N'-diacetylchitobiose transport system permease protein
VSVATRSPTERRRVRPRTIVLSVVGIAVALVWVFPVYWMLNSSLLPNIVLQNTTPTFFPMGGSLANFVAVVQGGTFLPRSG